MTKVVVNFLTRYSYAVYREYGTIVVRRPSVCHGCTLAKG